MKPTDHFIDLRGLKIHYVEWGARKGQPIILVHGFLDHARSWDPFVKHLQEKSNPRRWLVAMDCRGHGDSGWIGSGGYYHFPDYVFDLHALIQSLQSPEVILIGHSMGGTISFLYAGTFPQQVKKLVLVEGLGPQGLDFGDAPERMKQWIQEIEATPQRKTAEYFHLEDGAQRLQSQNPRLPFELALHLARCGMKQGPNGKWEWKFDPLHRTSSPQPFYTGQALEFFRRILCPVLVLRGRESHHRHRTDLDERVNAMAHRRCAEIDAAGHMVHHDNPAGLAEAVLEFLGEPC